MNIQISSLQQSEVQNGGTTKDSSCSWDLFPPIPKNFLLHDTIISLLKKNIFQAIIELLGWSPRWPRLRTWKLGREATPFEINEVDWTIDGVKVGIYVFHEHVCSRNLSKKRIQGIRISFASFEFLTDIIPKNTRNTILSKWLTKWKIDGNFL